MAWRNLFRKTTDATGPDPAPAPVPERPVHPHLAQAIEKRTGRAFQPLDDPTQRKRAGLERQRVAILFDIEQGELAASPENPWTARIALLTDALATVSDDLAAAAEVQPGPWHPLPATPIAIGEVTAGDVVSVAFMVGSEIFRYEEEPDWAERGHQITRGELILREGDASALLPPDVPPGLRDALRAHLEDSLFVFASDLRNRVLDEEPLPNGPTLADLARPCPTCGGWSDWHGTCQACARRQAAMGALKREERRLLDERNEEAEERHRLVEGLPLARRRLRDVEADLARFDAG